MLTSKAINLDIMRIKLPYSLIIELNPFVFTLFDVAEIVAKFRTAVM